MRSHGTWSRKGGVTVVVIAAVMFAGAAVAASRVLQSNRDADGARSVANPSMQQRRAVLARAVSFVPKADASDVAPDSRVVVSTAMGWLLNIQVSSADGRDVGGKMDVTGHHWLSAGTLQSGTTYRVAATVFDGTGVTAVVSSQFRTLTVTAPVTATLFPSDGMSPGVAQPVVVRFDHDIDSDAARASVLSHITVTESQPVMGGWHWFSEHELHFRPRVYWPAGERVTVASNLEGWNAGDGRWGVGAQLVHFTVGDAHVSVANLATHRMDVRENGRVVASYAMSGGSTKYPTMNGDHIVMDRESVVHMVSSTVGIPVNSPDGYDELVYADVHISDSGEYVHSAPWSVDSQGDSNVSHGCINLSPADALAFFAFSRVGDVVTVVEGPRPPAVGDHGVMDWGTEWAQWTPVELPPSAAPKALPMPGGIARPE